MKRKNIIKALATFIIFYYGKYFQLIPIYLFNIGEQNIKIKLSLSIFSNVCECIIFFFIFRDDLKKEFSKYKNNIGKCLDCGVKYWLLGFLVMIISNVIIGLVFHGHGATNEKLIQSMTDAIPFIMLINVSILGPFIEEIVFRKSFRLLIKNDKLYILISGLIFGSLHVLTTFQTPIELLYFIPYSSLGIALAAMYVKTDSIFTPLSMHMFHNFTLTFLTM